MPGYDIDADRRSILPDGSDVSGHLVGVDRDNFVCPPLGGYVGTVRRCELGITLRDK